MGVSKTISCPADLDGYLKCFVHVVHADCILIEDVIKITYCLVVLDPTSVGYLQLPIMQQLCHLSFLCRSDIVKPILEEDYLSCEELAFTVFGKGCQHRVVYCFRIALIHLVQE